MANRWKFNFLKKNNLNNQSIKSYFIKLEKNYTSKINSFSNLDNLTLDLFQDLKDFDFQTYKANLKIEINENLNEWWVNPEKGIIKSEELFAILLEFGDFFMNQVQAESYGIGVWKDYKVQTEKFDMGFDYDFTTEFYASPGITLDFFNPLSKLDYKNLPEEYKDIDGILGMYELIELYKIKGFLAIHEVLVEMDSENLFEKLNYKNNFMFLIDEHDSGEVYPLLIKNR